MRRPTRPRSRFKSYCDMIWLGRGCGTAWLRWQSLHSFFATVMLCSWAQKCVAGKHAVPVTKYVMHLISQLCCNAYMLLCAENIHCLDLLQFFTFDSMNTFYSDVENLQNLANSRPVSVEFNHCWLFIHVHPVYLHI